jgi:hypothetical protein
LSTAASSSVSPACCALAFSSFSCLCASAGVTVSPVRLAIWFAVANRSIQLSTCRGMSALVYWICNLCWSAWKPALRFATSEASVALEIR